MFVIIITILSLLLSCSLSYPTIPLLESQEQIKAPSTINKTAKIVTPNIGSLPYPYIPYYDPNYFRTKRQVGQGIQFPENWQQNMNQRILRQEEYQIRKDEEHLLRDEEKLRLQMQG